jgi:hypothetical protein
VALALSCGPRQRPLSSSVRLHTAFFVWVQRLQSFRLVSVELLVLRCPLGWPADISGSAAGYRNFALALARPFACQARSFLRSQAAVRRSLFTGRPQPSRLSGRLVRAFVLSSHVGALVHPNYSLKRTAVTGAGAIMLCAAAAA